MRPDGGLYRSTSFDDAEATAAAAWSKGIRYFDTAPYYGYTRSERRIGVMLSERPRDEFIVSTKAGRLMVPDAIPEAKRTAGGPIVVPSDLQL